MAKQVGRKKKSLASTPTVKSKEITALTSEKFLDFMKDDVEKNKMYEIDNKVEVAFSLAPPEKLVLMNYINPLLKGIYLKCKGQYKGKLNEFKFQPLDEVNEVVTGAVRVYQKRFPDRNANKGDLKKLVDKEITDIQNQIKSFPEEIKFGKYLDSLR